MLTNNGDAMPSRLKKKQRLEDQSHGVVEVAHDNFVEAAMSFDKLSGDVMAIIFGFLHPNDIMRSRLNKKMRDAATKTMVPPTKFVVDSVRSYNAMRAMTTALPNLQQIKLKDVGLRVIKYTDGEDPDEHEAARTANRTTHDIDIISNFRKLRILELYIALLNGRYPVLFNFPLLQKLTIYCTHLKWDLEMLAGMPVLKALNCYCNDCLTGNISSLRVLKDTLEKVRIDTCKRVEGNFMDLADFPHLKVLTLDDTTAVRGDIRDIRDIDFPKLELFTLPKTVYGGRGYEFQRISDGPDVIRTLYLFKQHRPTILMPLWFAVLSTESPDRYNYDGDDDDYYDYDNDETPPFYIHFVEAGSRVGYRWETLNNNPCEVNWLDPEPDKGSSDYSNYIQDLQGLERKVDRFRGFYQPPTEEEYNEL
jgi:hypothetical protein